MTRALCHPCDYVVDVEGVGRERRAPGISDNGIFVEEALFHAAGEACAQGHRRVPLAEWVEIAAVLGLRNLVVVDHSMLYSR